MWDVPTHLLDGVHFVGFERLKTGKGGDGGVGVVDLVVKLL